MIVERISKGIFANLEKRKTLVHQNVLSSPFHYSESQAYSCFIFVVVTVVVFVVDVVVVERGGCASSENSKSDLSN